MITPVFAFILFVAGTIIGLFFGYHLGILDRNAIQLRLGDNILPGWICKSCKAFNGDAKEKLQNCRACGGKR
jgi:hypothetical protein